MSLTALLDEQQRHLESLNAQLIEERDHLNAGRVDGAKLGEIAEHKQALLTTLDALERQRRAHQTDAGFGEGIQGAERLAQVENASETWQRIRQLAEAVRQTNRLNGHVISQRLEHNQHAIDFLQRAVGGSTYGPKGQSMHKGFGGISSSA